MKKSTLEPKSYKFDTNSSERAYDMFSFVIVMDEPKIRLLSFM